MINVYTSYQKGKYEILAVASHQRDLNNLRLMSYRLNDGKDRVQLNKDKYGGPYLKISADAYLLADGTYNKDALESYVNELRCEFS